jgi:hypothetical protein
LIDSTLPCLAEVNSMHLAIFFLANMRFITGKRKKKKKPALEENAFFFSLHWLRVSLFRKASA